MDKKAVTMNESVLDLIDEYREKLLDEFNAYWIACDATILRLDSRAGSGLTMWASAEGLATVGNTRNLEYYGGFEYIDKRDIVIIKDITIWSSEEIRVRECLYRVLPPAKAHDLARMHGEYDEYFGEE